MDKRTIATLHNNPANQAFIDEAKAAAEEYLELLKTSRDSVAIHRAQGAVEMYQRLFEGFPEGALRVNTRTL